MVQNISLSCGTNDVIFSKLQWFSVDEQIGEAILTHYSNEGQ